MTACAAPACLPDRCSRTGDLVRAAGGGGIDTMRRAPSGPRFGAKAGAADPRARSGSTAKRRLNHMPASEMETAVAITKVSSSPDAKVVLISAHSNAPLQTRLHNSIVPGEQAAELIKNDLISENSQMLFSSAAKKKSRLR